MPTKADRQRAIRGQAFRAMRALEAAVKDLRALPDDAAYIVPSDRSNLIRWMSEGAGDLRVALREDGEAAGEAAR